eukprot:CAMPEP_0194749214 /NCGR_PEP_ID=MMETSP0323_2-20130528/3410_1 /TAXON_ID=2866 ORGANISM="Crypthecodinium cohnii, Strain Seligo" /NCGR_SAMPLE_ID=MMETSP0323_2 /ASSEMBLY_ACC=CAM_ASM_000346 /LENGTH=266 /DNA_ID=CAMNT_0039664153 /DNA_START=80 /DNA_END=880 /DNA_ORIENTATION=+
MSGAASAVSAAAAAAKYSGKFAVHPLLPGAAQLAVDSCTGRLKPRWTPKAQELFNVWDKVGVCMPRYAEFLKKTNRKDLKRIHVFMNEKAQAKLAEFYLCCALKLRPDEIEAAGQDSEKLLKLANEVATTEVEPFFEDCRNFVKDYDWELHEKLDNTTIWREVEDSLFWHHSFEAAAPKTYLAYRQKLLPAQDKWPASDDTAGIQEVLERVAGSVDEGGCARTEAEEVYQAFLEASSMPIKASIRSALIDHGIMAGEVVYRGNQEE